MRRWLAAAVVIGGCVAAGAAHAQPAHLAPDELPNGALESEPPAIEVLTFGVGARIFEKFGHAALCLRYHQPEHPAVCFNYGVTDFSAGGAMVWNFLRSKQRFWVEPTSLASMMSFYQWEDRDIWRQVLPLSGPEARVIEAKLWANLDEARRFYVYDHFFDNCTTRLRDLIDDATGGALQARTAGRYPRTFREIGRGGLAGMPALLVISDVMVGRQIDEYPTVWQAMFHPAIFRQQLEAQFGVAPELLYRRKGPPFPVEGSSGRLGLLAAGLAFAVPLLIAQWRRRFQRAALVWAALPLGVLGAAVWGLAILSSIPAVRFNEVALVLVPLDLALPFLGARRRRGYALARLGLLALVSLLAAIGVLHQPLWILIAVAFVPMATIALELPHGLAARLGRAEAALEAAAGAVVGPAGAPVPVPVPVIAASEPALDAEIEPAPGGGAGA